MNNEASLYARNSATDAIRASNLRTAQGMANSLGKPVESSDGQVAYPVRDLAALASLAGASQ